MSSPEHKVPAKEDVGSDAKTPEPVVPTDRGLLEQLVLSGPLVMPVQLGSPTDLPAAIDADTPTKKVTQSTLDVLDIGQESASGKIQGAFEFDMGFGDWEEDKKDPLEVKKSEGIHELDEAEKAVQKVLGFLLRKESSPELETFRLKVLAVRQKILVQLQTLQLAGTELECEAFVANAKKLKVGEALPLLREAGSFPDAYPMSWTDYHHEHHAAFKIRLCQFRGGGAKDKDILKPSPGFRGGEGQLFLSERDKNKALKRWFIPQLPQMAMSVKLLFGARKCIDGNLILKGFLDIIDVFEYECDWILRGFDPDSIPLKRALQQSEVLLCKKNALGALEKAEDAISIELRRKLEEDSANLHWSPTLKKILVIDMM